jgi:carboxyl-terminal processing protease
MNNGGALKITTARYYTPLGRSIQARGIEPDIVVEQAQLNSVDDDRREIRESDLAGHLQNDREAAESDTEEDDAQSDLPSRDYQVREALNLLKGMSLVKLRDEKQAVKPDEG